jgi:hypothetical protein
VLLLQNYLKNPSFLWNSILALYYRFMHSRFTQLIGHSTRLKDFI